MLGFGVCLKLLDLAGLPDAIGEIGGEIRIIAGDYPGMLIRFHSPTLPYNLCRCVVMSQEWKPRSQWPRRPLRGFRVQDVGFRV